VITIIPLAVTIGFLLLTGACETQEKQPAQPAKAAVAAPKTTPPSGKVEAPQVKMEPGEPRPRSAAKIGRDPFRPLTVTARTNVQRRENLSPLERFEIGQLKLVGVVWDVSNPTALVEDSSGLGYTLRIGTPIGANDGKVKAIAPHGIIIEEDYIDPSGARRKREVSMMLTVER
jgi:type IV pilus assembly protein PilP